MYRRLGIEERCGATPGGRTCVRGVPRAGSGNLKLCLASGFCSRGGPISTADRQQVMASAVFIIAEGDVALVARALLRIGFVTGGDKRTVSLFLVPSSVFRI